MNRISGMMIIDVSGANPNGSPDWDNLPRQFNKGYGYISPVCLKRKCRDPFVDHSSICFQELSEKFDFDPENYHIFESHERGFPGYDPKKAREASMKLAQNVEAFLQKYWDIRIFGGTILEDAKQEKKNKDKEKEDSAFRWIKTGCITFSPACSIAPIQIEEATISKKATFRDKSSDLAPGAYKFVVHGLYVCTFSFNPHVAHHTMCQPKDLEVFKGVLPYIFSLSQSAARPTSTIAPVHIWWREHDNTLGSFNEYLWFKSLMPTTKVETPKDLNDYVIPDGNKFGAVDLMNKK